MSEELQKIVDEYREKEIHISDEEAEQILWLCNRKMDICKIENREEYLPLLFNQSWTALLLSSTLRRQAFSTGSVKEELSLLPDAQKSRRTQ